MDVGVRHSGCPGRNGSGDARHPRWWGGGLVLGLIMGGWFASWFASRRAHWLAGGFTGRSLGYRLRSGLHGLQLLATTVSSLLSSSAGRWNGLLLRVWHRWINGICRMTLGAVILLDVVATLGGEVVATL
jgi:hypothetical protein